MKQLEDWVEDLFVRHYKGFRAVWHDPPGKDDELTRNADFSTRRID
jgi:hypothetical protein